MSKRLIREIDIGNIRFKFYVDDTEFKKSMKNARKILNKIRGYDKNFVIDDSDPLI